MNKQKLFLVLFIVSFSFVTFSSLAAPEKGKQNPDGKRNQAGQGPQGVFQTEVPQHDFDIILGRATQNTITLSILAYQDVEGYCEYGVNQGEFSVQTKPVKFVKGEPLEISLKGLQPNSSYYYRFDYRKPDAKDYTKSAVYTFHTQRTSGNAFVFTVQADPHLDENTSTDIYKATLVNELAAKPDFQIDLGDTFMTNKYRENFKDSFQQYLAQRYYFGLVCHSAPLYLTQGNHDGEGWIKNSSPDNMTVWATTVRKRYYPNPFPDGFYTGNEIEEPLVGLPENYYAWEWGDALFIVLDPYRYTPVDNPWDRTLGEKQYRWLQQTLEKSKAKFKFIFIHNLVGGADLNGKARGGAEVAKYYEWGGLNEDGSKGFQQHRPGWGQPIHDLLVQHHVSAVFHGHDHFFAKQELDGVIYQMGPQPGNPRASLGQVKEYGYKDGMFLPGAGYLRVSVSAKEVKVDYVRSNAGKETNDLNGEGVYSYIIK